MLDALDEIQAKLDTLVAALDGHDAGAIIEATEALAASVTECRGTALRPGSETRACMLIEQTLRQLEAAAIRVNILKNWTRQRIDSNNQIRGVSARCASLSY